MQEQSLQTALGSLANYAQFYAVRLTWLPAENKFQKIPCYPDGSPYAMDAAKPENWLTFDAAARVVALLDARNDGCRYALGFYLTKNLNKWFLDIDNCVDAIGQLNEVALECWRVYQGCFIEWSSSCKGMHVIGSGNLPEHSCRNKHLNIELYSDARSITFGLTGKAWGSADFLTLAPLQHFPPRDIGTAGQWDNGPRADWRGPTDDDELIRRACASHSAAAVFAGKAGFADLWQRNVPVLAQSYPDAGSDVGYGESEADQALAQHLAFWTGCDAERMERLMRRSALARDKWDTHRTYLRELTITNACALQRDVCIDKIVEPKMSVVVTPEQQLITTNYIEQIVNASEEQLRNTIIPAIAQDRSVQPLDRQRLAQLLKDRFAVFQIPTTIAMCRNMLRMQAVKADEEEESAAVPAFAREHVYVLSDDAFLNLETGIATSKTGFNAQYNRLMPVRMNGDREDAAKWCLERWGTRTIDATMYAPGKEAIFLYAGRWFANIFCEKSFPAAAESYTANGVACIERFLKLLWLTCGERNEVYTTLIDWLAHNVQYPGVKVRYSPLIKGVDGDGKSIIATVLRACMGSRNVRSLGPSIIANTGGFTGWAEGFAVQACEELYVSGADRYRVYNMVKEFISNSYCSVNAKGKEPKEIINCTNYIGFTNYVNAIPITATDRRWWIIFTPFSNCMQLAERLGITSANELNKYFGTIFSSLDNEPGEWRKYFIEHAISADFNPNGHAPFTDEKELMMINGEDEYEAIARQIIDGGCEGVSSKVISSSCLSMAMRTTAMLDGFEPPKTTMLHHLLLRLGFSQVSKTIKWKGKTHRVWIANGVKVSTDMIKELLDETCNLCQ